MNISDKASEEEAIAGVDDSKWMTPKKVKILAKSVSEPSAKIGDIKWSARNLYKETGGKYFPCSGGSLAVDYYPEYINAVGYKFGFPFQKISGEIRGTKYTSSKQNANLSSATIGSSPYGGNYVCGAFLDNTNTQLVMFSISGDTVSNIRSLPVSSTSYPIFSFYIDNHPYVLISSDSSSIETALTVYSIENKKSVATLPTVPNNSYIYGIYSTHEYTLIYAYYKVTKLTRTSDTALTVSSTDITSIVGSIDTAKNAFVVKDNLVFFNKSWKKYIYSSNSILDCSFSEITYIQQVFPENTNTSTRCVTYGNNKVVNSIRGKYLEFNSNGVITSYHSIYRLNYAIKDSNGNPEEKTGGFVFIGKNSCLLDYHVERLSNTFYAKQIDSGISSDGGSIYLNPSYIFSDTRRIVPDFSYNAMQFQHFPTDLYYMPVFGLIYNFVSTNNYTFTPFCEACKLYSYTNTPSERSDVFNTQNTAWIKVKE